MVKLSYTKIPPELRQRTQWAVSTMTPRPDGKPDKAPRSPLTGALISVTDPSSWATFEQAVNSGYPAIGYILHESDPFAIIDLDSTSDETVKHRQGLIYQSFDGYAERSISGKGCHIVVQGYIGGGCRRDAVEVYDRERYMIFTGDVVRAKPIMANPIMLGQLVAEMGGASAKSELPESEPERHSDDVIIQKATEAYNGNKFRDLYYGPIPKGADMSQRDSALAQFIAFWTRDHEQALRLFRKSAQYRTEGKGGYTTTEEYEQTYLLRRTFGHAWRMLNKDNVQEAADIEHGGKIAAALLANTPSPAPVGEEACNGFAYTDEAFAVPDGLLGEVAQYIYNTANRPVWQIALGGAIAFLAGVTGRQYNVSGTGLNHYVLIVADTGRGKESASAGIDRLFDACKQTMPMVDTFRGPGHLASGQALIRTMSEQPCILSVLSEFGHTLKIITNTRASMSDMRTRQVLLDLFAKSGAGRQLQSAAYADKEKNTKVVDAPNFCLLGDTTPEVFYRCFESDLVNEGFMPRLLTLEYSGERVPSNPYAAQMPPASLVDKINMLITSIAQMQYSNQYKNVELYADAKAYLDDYDRFCDAKINADKTGTAELWNRAHLKALRLAALAAVGTDHHQPAITLAQAQWAIKIINADIYRLLGRINAGEVGEGEVRHESGLVRCVIDFLRMNKVQRAAYDVPEVMQEGVIVPFTYIRRRCRLLSDFTNDRRGIKRAISEAIEDALNSELLVELSRDQIANMGLSSRTRAYMPGDALRFK